MRKTLAEALKWFKEKKDLEAVQSDKIVEKVSGIAPKKIITIKVVECKDLVSKLSKNIVPFFYYQFFTYDEHYSKTLNGKSPIFDDQMEFEVKLDQMFKDYVMATGLEIFFFDDAAPLMETEQKDDISDMIGTANIDLSPLLKGDPISKTVLIKDLKNRDCGSVTVIIGIRDFKIVRKVKEKTYSPEWEDEFILKVCVELVKGIKDPTLEKAFDELSKH